MEVTRGSYGSGGNSERGIALSPLAVVSAPRQAPTTTPSPTGPPGGGVGTTPPTGGSGRTGDTSDLLLGLRDDDSLYFTSD